MGDGFFHVEGPVFHGRHDQIPGRLQGRPGDGFVPGPNDDLVHAPHRGFPGLAEAAGHARQILQFQGHVFQDVARPGAFLDPAQKAAPFLVGTAVLNEAGQPGGKTFVETGDGVGRTVFQVADVDQGFQYRPIGPHIGTGKMGDAQKLDGFFFHRLSKTQRHDAPGKYSGMGIPWALRRLSAINEIPFERGLMSL